MALKALTGPAFPIAALCGIVFWLPGDHQSIKQGCRARAHWGPGSACVLLVTSNASVVGGVYIVECSAVHLPEPLEEPVHQPVYECLVSNVIEELAL